ncbi:MAG: CRTAC1 family protein [Acidobacteriota bacterium]
MRCPLVMVLSTVWIVVSGATGLSAQVTFVENGATHGITGHQVPGRGFGAGASAADFDDDGDIDVFVPTGADTPDRLYRNLGDGSFEDVAAALGVASQLRSRAALWFDADGDGRLDLVVGSDCYQLTCDAGISLLRLYRQNVDGTFTDVTATSGLVDLDTGHNLDEHRSGIAAGDLDDDGDLDLVTGYWLGRLHLYRNDGDGTFTDISLDAGFDTQVLGYHQPMIHDVDGDGRMDIYVSVDFSFNRLWHNQGLVDGIPSFVDIAATANCDNAMNDMGVALGDVDGDGDGDFYVTNIFRLTFHNVLQRNDTAGGTIRFAEISEAAGVDDGGWGWGTSFFDVDHDTDLDLAETNGWNTSTWDQPPRLWLRQPVSPPAFVEQAASVGLTDERWGSSLLAVDIDRDGDLDLLETVQGTRSNAVLLRHENQLAVGAPDRHYLVVRPRMLAPNVRAIGARVEIEIAGQTQVRWITAGTSYLGQEPAEAHFGLGSATMVDRVTIAWPGGGETTRRDVAADQVLTVLDSPVFSDDFESEGLDRWSGAVPSVRR